MKPFFIFSVLFSSLFLQAQTPASYLIPKPVRCTDLPGSFELTRGQISFPSALEGVAKLLAELLQQQIVLAPASTKSNIVLKQVANSELGDEGYTLDISSDKITLTAQTPRGAIRGVMSLAQLQLLQSDKTLLPCAKIYDRPRFVHRGMHLDVSRNFFPVSFIKKNLDVMALYKFNTFHWHLTDGPGWRLEIKKYPKLTSMAAFRTHSSWTDWTAHGSKLSTEGNPNAYGGYYTQQEAREIVAYAAQRGIVVMPEIEMPGHSDEVLNAYPELSCSGKPYTQGELCIGNPKTISFLEDVMTEVMDIFPSAYLHVGGDEAGTQAWQKCSKCQGLKNAQGLKNEHELQAYLIKHMEKFLKQHGHKLIGWDEIIEGGLPPDATVMSWRGMSGGIKAVKEGHDVVMTPGETYLDAYQSDPTTEPLAIGGFRPIGTVYNFEPVPSEMSTENARHILGTQANLWTEYMPTTYQVEYMAYPRALAIAEVAWTQKELKSFEDFQRRLQKHYLLLQRLSVNYYRPSTFLTVSESPDPKLRRDKITIVSEQYQPEIRYTTDGSTPTANSSLYTKPFYTSGQTKIKAAVFSNGELLGTATAYTADYHKAIGKKVTFNSLWSESYPAQREQTLTNGIKGSLTYGDQQWLGYLKNFDVTIDMDTVQKISSVAIRFMHQPGPGVYLPASVELQLSEDGKKFVTLGKASHNFDPKDKKLAFKNFEFLIPNQRARYIRIIAPNNMGGFMFTDEIIVY